MNSYDLITPGSAVADTIQQILQRRRTDQREALLDQLRGEQVKDQFKTSDMERQKSADEMKTSEMNRKTLQEQLIEHQLQGLQEGADPSQFSPELAEAARSRGYMHKSTPQVGTSSTFQGAEGEAPSVDPTTVAGPTTEVFKTTAQRERERLQSVNEAYIAQHPDMVKSNPDLMNVLSMRAGGLEAPITNEMVNAPPSIQQSSPSGALIGQPKQVPRGTVINQGSWSPASYQPKWQLQLDPTTGDGVFYSTNPGPHGVPEIHREPGMTTPLDIPIVAPAALNAYNAALKRGNKEKEPDWHRRVAQYRTALGTNLNMRATTPRVGETVRAAINEVNSRESMGKSLPTMDMIVQMARKNFPDLTEKEVQQIGQVMNNILTPVNYGGQ